MPTPVARTVQVFAVVGFVHACILGIFIVFWLLSHIGRQIPIHELPLPFA